jgi:hypothetical protein
MSQSEQHADRGKVLLDGRPGCRALFHSRFAGVGHLQRLDIRGDMKGLDIDKPPMLCCSSQAKNEHTAR